VFLLAAHAAGAPSAEAANRAGALPTLNAFLNAAAALTSAAGWIFVRRGKVQAHKRAMLSAIGLSSLFLVSYLVHHAQVGSVKYAGVGLWRTLYFSVLVPHVVLAVPLIPLVIWTARRGWKEQIDAHKRIARVTLPIWLFVSITGVIVFFMLYHL
jgi:protein SCO1/2/putative membrane protein